MKFAFTTCVQLGKSVIEEIINLGGRFEFLVTLKDEKAKDKSGRIYLDDISEKYNIPLIKINNVNDVEVIEAIKEYEIDWMFIIGWSQIARSELLNAPKRGCIGMHPTLLPLGRGRASIPWAIIKGLNKTGVTMFRLDEGVDTGDIIGNVEIPLTDTITSTELYSYVNDAHITLIRKYWNDIVSDSIELIKQDESKATEWPGRRPCDGELFHTMTMDEAERLVRAVTHPYPGAFYFENNKKITVWSAVTSKNREGKCFEVSDGYLKLIKYEVGEL